MTAATRACSHCNGVGSIIVSLCCGRGCATCVGEQMQAVECFSCKGSGLTQVRGALGQAVDPVERDSEIVGERRQDS